MLRSRFVRKTYYASPQSDQALRDLKERYSLNTDSDCIRYALTRLAESPPTPVLVAKKKVGKPVT